VFTHLDQAAQLAPLHSEIPRLFLDRIELGLGSTDNLVGRPRLGGPQQLPDLAQREPQLPRPADERQPPPVGLGVLKFERLL
jgi:hypothetical protein